MWEDKRTSFLHSSIRFHFHYLTRCSVSCCIPTLPLTIATRESCLKWLVFMHMRPSNLFPTSIIYDHSPCHVIAHSPHQPSKTLTAIRPFHRSSPSFIIQAGPYRNGSRSSDRPWHWLELICWLFTHECLPMNVTLCATLNQQQKQVESVALSS